MNQKAKESKPVKQKTQDTKIELREVLFVDSSTGVKFVTRSTLKTDKKETYKGVEYPVCHLSVSSSSHPFFTGNTQFVDAEGRVDKFQKRYRKGAPAEKVAEVTSQDQKKK